ncbi:hypothetical protein Rsub_05324 [Raphidocelis subcapitata]|uniref:Uncharacterized protein n=1 Tax=Raphidocelis subcapitata TaxID=307507 RepID=A0A2V0NX79_9CHLO|nr:hypothetical protein Rsub_05324 [Raphidocelis subcapitata]|eukprot:GBF92241.1 hypothetical protein Rsub_05324 [Raphidocelis subcapitata]
MEPLAGLKRPHRLAGLESVQLPPGALFDAQSLKVLLAAAAREPAGGKRARCEAHAAPAATPAAALGLLLQQPNMQPQLFAALQLLVDARGRAVAAAAAAPPPAAGPASEPQLALLQQLLASQLQQQQQQQQQQAAAPAPAQPSPQLHAAQWPAAPAAPSSLPLPPLPPGTSPEAAARVVMQHAGRLLRGRAGSPPAAVEGLLGALEARLTERLRVAQQQLQQQLPSPQPSQPQPQPSPQLQLQSQPQTQAHSQQQKPAAASPRHPGAAEPASPASSALTTSTAAGPMPEGGEDLEAAAAEQLLALADSSATVAAGGGSPALGPAAAAAPPPALALPQAAGAAAWDDQQHGASLWRQPSLGAQQQPQLFRRRLYSRPNLLRRKSFNAGPYTGGAPQLNAADGSDAPLLQFAAGGLARDASPPPTAPAQLLPRPPPLPRAAGDHGSGSSETSLALAAPPSPPQLAPAAPPPALALARAARLALQSLLDENAAAGGAGAGTFLPPAVTSSLNQTALLLDSHLLHWEAPPGGAAAAAFAPPADWQRR